MAKANQAAKKGENETKAEPCTKCAGKDAVINLLVSDLSNIHRKIDLLNEDIAKAAAKYQAVKKVGGA